jgi:hypothetical protein
VKTILKVVRNKESNFTRWISSLGTVVGLVIILVSIQLFQDVHQLLNQKDTSLKEQNLVISKEISQLSFLQKEKKGFNSTELKELEAISNVNDLAPFESCNYKVMISLGDQNNGIPGFYTLAFFESIPERFLDLKTDFSAWDSLTKEVPVVLPKNYLDAYNYGLALSMNTPQVSEDLIKNIRFKINLEGNGQKATYIGRVNGLSEKINSILVPIEFLNYTNEKYGTTSREDFSRIIITVEDPHDEEFTAFLKANNYKSSENIQKDSLVQILLKTLFSYQVIIALIIILQGLLLMLFYARILVQTSKQDVQKLFLIGYNVAEITKAFEQTLWRIYVFIFGISILVAISVKYIIAYQLVEKTNIDISYFINITTLLTWALIALVFFALNRWNLKKKLRMLL